MRACPKCRSLTVGVDGYCGGICREKTLQPFWRHERENMAKRNHSSGGIAARHERIKGVKAKHDQVFQSAEDSEQIFAMIEEMREAGWLVVLKAMPAHASYIIEGSRSEFDAPHPDKAVGQGMWCCELMWMGPDYRVSPCVIKKTAREAVTEAYNCTKNAQSI